MFRRLWTCALGAAMCGCESPQSALAGLGPEAGRVLVLTWIMFVGGTAIFLLVAALSWLALRGPATWKRRIARRRVVIWGGVAFPVVVLSALLAYGFLATAPAGRPSTDPDALHIQVVGERWWWRVRYRHSDGSVTESANEIRLPVGRAVELELTTADVIHSFWLPAYAGKVDMIPGRSNRLNLRADQPGIVRGQCAEYCGGAHALMSFYAQAMEPQAFQDWLAREKSDAEASGAGLELFLASGCGGCHAIRGTAADGRIGPDLTHVGSRHTIGAGILPNGERSIARWIRHHQDIKPGNLMPPFDFFTPQEVETLSSYLAGLK